MTTRSKYDSPQWDDGAATMHTFSQFERLLRKWSVANGTAYVLFTDTTKITAPEGEGHAQKIAAANASMWEALHDAVDEITWTAIVPDEAAAADAYDAKELWKLFETYAKGHIAALSGPDMMTKIYAWTWPSTGNAVEQVTTAIHDLKGFLTLHNAIADAKYPVTMALLCHRFRTEMPASFQIHEARYRGYDTFQDLLAQGKRDATLIDANPERLSILNTRTIARPAGGGRAKHCKYHPDATTHDTSECRDKDSRTPRTNGRRSTASKKAGTGPCYICGETGHWMQECPQLGKEAQQQVKALVLKGQQQAAKTQGTVLCHEGPDGTLTKCFAFKCTLPNDTARALLSTDRPAANISIYVDSAGEISVDNDIAHFESIDMYPATNRPQIEGVGGPPIYIHGHGIRILRIDVGNGRVLEIPETVVYVPGADYTITSTNTLAKLGFSTKIDATSTNQQLSIIPEQPHIKQVVSKIDCKRVGNLWAMPILPFAPTGTNNVITTATLRQADAVLTTTTIAAAAVLEKAFDDVREIDVSQAYLQGELVSRPEAAAVLAYVQQAMATDTPPSGKALLKTMRKEADNHPEWGTINNKIVRTARAAAEETGNVVAQSWYGWPTGGSAEDTIATAPAAAPAVTTETAAAVKLTYAEFKKTLSGADADTVQSLDAKILCHATIATKAYTLDHWQFIATAFLDTQQAAKVRALATAHSSADRQVTARPVQYRKFIASLGGTSERRARTLAKRLGIKLSTQPDRDFDIIVATANQVARAVRPWHHDPPASPGIITAGDTMGGTFPRSKAGSTVCITWIVVDDNPADPYVTFHSSHSSANAVAGFKTFVRDANIKLRMEPQLNQDAVFASDEGTEFKGAFDALLAELGIKHECATPNKKNTGKAGKIERAQRTVQGKMRVNLKLAAANLLKFNLTKADVWDKAASHGAYAARRENEIAKLPETASDEQRAAARERYRRLLPTHFGAFATMTLQPQSAGRKSELKQFGDRATAVLYLGTDTSNRYIVVDRHGKIHHTIDVNFNASDLSTADMEDAEADTDEDWMIPVPTARQLIPDNGPGNGETIHPLVHSDNDDDDNDAIEVLTDEDDVEEVFEYQLGNKVSAKFNEHWYDGIIAQTKIDDNDANKDSVLVLFPEDNTKEWYRRPFFDNVTITDIGDADDILEPASSGESSDDDSNDATEANASLTTRVLQARAKAPFQPHPTVAAYMNGAGQIKHELLRGIQKLPPQPALPDYTSEAHPPPPKTVLQALAGPDAIYWLHAIISEVVGHVTVAHTFRVAPLHDMPELRANGKWTGVKGTWTLTYKWAGDGVKLERFKAREAMGAHKHAVEAGVHYDPLNTYSSNAPMQDLRNLEAIGVEKDLDIREIDVSQAYLQAEISPRPDGQAITLRQPDGTRMLIDAAALQPTTEDLATASHDIDGTMVTNPSMSFTNDSANAAETGNVVAKSWYGWPTGGSDWSNKLSRTLTGADPSKAGACPIQLKQCSAQPCIYHIKDAEFPDTFFVIWTQTDNLRLYSSSPEVTESFLTWIRGTFPITGGEEPLQKQPATTCVGTQFRYTPGKVELSNAAYIEQMLAEYNLSDCNVPKVPMTPGFTLTSSDRPHTEAGRAEVVETAAKLFPTQDIYTYTEAATVFRKVLMSISWYAGQTGPALRLAVSKLAKGMQSPSIKGFKALKTLLRFTKDGITNPIVYRKTRDWAIDEWPQLEFGSDASYNDDPDNSKSQGGYIGRFKNQAASTFVSKQSATVVTSTYQAETHFASDAAKEIVYQRAVLNEIGVTQTGPTPLHVDNAAAVLDVNCRVRKFSKKNKHFTLQERYARQCSEQGEIKMIKTPGTELDADAMTKALPRALFGAHHNTLHYGGA